MGEDLGIGQGRSRRAHLSRIGLGGKTDKIEIVTGMQGMMLGAAGDILKDTKALGIPYGATASQFVNLANIGLDILG